MNRANFGNVITNGQQILSVGATTASRLLGHAESALNNLTKEERTDYYNMKADKMRDEISEYKDGKKSIDEAMGQQDKQNSPIKVKSEQEQPLSTYVSNNLADLKERLAKMNIGIDYSFKDPKTGRIMKKDNAIKIMSEEEI